MNPKEAHDLIRAACLRRPELAYKAWPKEMGLRLKDVKLPPYRGFCYIASHAFSFLTDAEVWADNNDERDHYWNMIDGEVWDLTKDQFDYKYPYHLGHKIPRKKKNLPERVRELLKETVKIQAEHPILLVYERD